MSRIQSPPPARTPVDGGDGRSAHWEASAGIGLLRRGKSAGTFLLHEQAQQQHSELASGREADGGKENGNTSGSRGHSGKRHADGNRDHDSRGPSARTPKNNPDRQQEEDQQTVSAITTDTAFTLQNSDAGTTMPPRTGEGHPHNQQEHNHSPQRQHGGVEVDGSVGNGTYNTVESNNDVATNLAATAPNRGGTLPPPMPAPAATIQELHGRARLQHMPKTLGDVVVAAGGNEAANDPNIAVDCTATGQVVPCRKSKQIKRAGDPDGVRAGSEVAREGGGVDVAGNGSDGGADDNKNQRQQRALQAFLQGVS